MSSLYIFVASMNQNCQDYILCPQFTPKAERIVFETKLQLAPRIPFEVSKKRLVPALHKSP
jgi:hypothetical protein